MDLNSIISQYKKVVIQIATPYSTGTGFYLTDYNLIVTNEHVVRDNREVVIDGESIEKQMVPVIFVDPKYDLAFLGAPDMTKLPTIKIRKNEEVKEGDGVIAVGHPYGMKFGATQGIVSSTMHNEGDINYIRHDAALNPGNSGGPLINKSGELIGVNTFIIRDGNSIGFSLPVKYLAIALEEFQNGRGQAGVRCNACLNIIFEADQKSRYCHICGSKIKMISSIASYEPLGINKTIESMLRQLEYNVELSRRGPNNWEINHGSATITISYHTKSGLIVCDAFLCLLPKDNIQPLYEYLLRENYRNESLTFSVRNQDIIISLLIYDQYLNTESATEIFKNLFSAADHYDDILVNQFGAFWKEERSTT